jgi:hypothetical protein
MMPDPAARPIASPFRWVDDNDHLGTLMPFGAPSTPSFRATWRAGENLSCRSFLGKEFATSVYAMVRAAKFNRIHHKDAKAARPVGPCL